MCYIADMPPIKNHTTVSIPHSLLEQLNRARFRLIRTEGRQISHREVIERGLRALDLFTDAREQAEQIPGQQTVPLTDAEVFDPAALAVALPEFVQPVPDAQVDIPPATLDPVLKAANLCACGRTFEKPFGLRIHQRTCGQAA